MCPQFFYPTCLADAWCCVWRAVGVMGTRGAMVPPDQLTLPQAVADCTTAFPPPPSWISRSSYPWCVEGGHAARVEMLSSLIPYPTVIAHALTINAIVVLKQIRFGDFKSLQTILFPCKSL